MTGVALEGTPSITCEATESSPVGTYPIVISKGSVKNYNDSYVNGTLTITRAPLTITAQNFTIVQGEELPTFWLTYSGFKNDETEDILTKKAVVTCAATTSETPGTYDINVSGAEAENYDISLMKGTLTIIQAEAVVVTAQSYTREYGEENPTFEYTSEGKALEGTPEITCEATESSPVGTYPIVITKGTVKNYNDSYVNGTLTITKAPLTITAKSYIIKQSEELPTFEVLYSGFKNDETEGVIKKPTIVCVATSTDEFGTYDIMVSDAEAQTFVQPERGVVEIPHSSDKDTYVYVYGADASANAKQRVAGSETENGVLIYGIKWKQEEDTTCIEVVAPDHEVSCQIYSLNGMRVDSLRKGMNIIRYSNGIVKKVYVR